MSADPRDVRAAHRQIVAAYEGAEALDGDERIEAVRAALEDLCRKVAAGSPVAWETGLPGATFIQWKGTKVCMDVLCPACGEGGHVCAEFAYSLLCKACGTLIEVGSSVALRALPGDWVTVGGSRPIPFGGDTDGTFP